MDCKALFKQTQALNTVDFDRVLLCDVCPSKNIEGIRFKRVNWIMYDKHTSLQLNSLIREKGFILYAEHNAYITDNLWLKYKDLSIKNYDCPPSISALMDQIFIYEPELGMIVMHSLFCKMMRVFRTADVAYVAADVAYVAYADVAAAVAYADAAAAAAAAAASAAASAAAAAADAADAAASAAAAKKKSRVAFKALIKFRKSFYANRRGG